MASAPRAAPTPRAPRPAPPGPPPAPPPRCARPAPAAPAAPGTYTLEVRALSYAPKRIADVVVKAGELVTVNTALTPEAIQLKEVVVESRARHDTDASLLAVRKKATTVGD